MYISKNPELQLYSYIIYVTLCSTLIVDKMFNALSFEVTCKRAFVKLIEYITDVSHSVDESLMSFTKLSSTLKTLKLIQLEIFQHRRRS